MWNEMKARRFVDEEAQERRLCQRVSAIAKLNSITATCNIADVAKLLDDDIKYFETISTRYTSAEKPDVKLRYGAFYNLAWIYFFTDQIENAKQLGNSIIANDYDKGDGKQIVAAAERLQQDMKTNNINTTHFDDAFILKN
jgi:hypothetical protein